VVSEAFLLAMVREQRENRLLGAGEARRGLGGEKKKTDAWPWVGRPRVRQRKGVRRGGIDLPLPYNKPNIVK